MLSLRAIVSSCRCVDAAGPRPWGSTGAAARWCSRSSRAARGFADRRSRPGCPWPRVNRSCSAISLPRSQVSDLQSPSGSCRAVSDQCIDDGLRVPARHLASITIARVTLDQSAIWLFLVPQQEVALPVARYSPIFDRAGRSLIETCATSCPAPIRFRVACRGATDRAAATADARSAPSSGRRGPGHRALR